MELSRIAAKPAVIAETTRVEKTGSKPRPAIRETDARTDSEAPPADDEPVRLPTRTGRYAVAVAILLALGGGGAYAYLAHGDAIREALGMTEPVVEEPAVEEPRPVVAPAEIEAARVEEHESAHAQAVVPEVGEAPAETAVRAERAPAPAAPTPARAERHPAPPAQPPEQEEARPAPTPPIAQGTTIDFSQGPVRVVVEGDGWAIVSHEGRELGRTPLDVRLPVGRQRLSVLPFGRGPARTVEVDVEWGARATVRVPVREPSGTEGFGNPY
jgi:hypothetical protein